MEQTLKCNSCVIFAKKFSDYGANLCLGCDIWNKTAQNGPSAPEINVREKILVDTVPSENVQASEIESAKYSRYCSTIGNDDVAWYVGFMSKARRTRLNRMSRKLFHIGLRYLLPAHRSSRYASGV